MTKPKEHLSLIYDHGIYWREGDRLHVECTESRILIPKGIIIDPMTIEGRTTKRRGVISFSAKVLDWSGWTRDVDEAALARDRGECNT